MTDTNTRRRLGDIEGREERRRTDLRQATLNALRIISDVLLTTSRESGASYKYRLALGTQLVERQVFEHLQRLPAQLDMGRMTERTYRDEVNSILTVWQDEHLFDKSALEHLDSAFNAQERERDEAEQERKLAEKRNKRKAAAKATAHTKVDDNDGENGKMDIDQEGDGDGEMGALEGQKDATHQAVSTAVASAEPDIVMTEAAANDKVPLTAPEIPGETAAARARRLRPRAEDMFASDGE